MDIPTQFAYRTQKHINVVAAAPIFKSLPDLQRPEGTSRCSVYSPCGRYFAWAAPESVTIVDASTGRVRTTLKTPNVFELGFSPKGTYFITWQRPSKDDNGDAIKNLVVWRIPEIIDSNTDAEVSHIVGSFVQKSQTGWNLQYTCDEQYCAFMVTNEVHYYQSGDLKTVWRRLRVDGVVEFSISPGMNYSIAVFIPERRGQPAAVKVFNLPNFEAAACQKSFFKGDKAQLKWNDEGTNLIVLAQTEVDKSGKSYYGETTLYILSATDNFDSRIDLDKDGPIHDVIWSPNSKEFGVVYGYMPAKTTLFNTRAVAIHNFALGPRNTILFSPNGRFVLVAGFGNLAGQMDVYDIEKDYKKVCMIEASNASVCQWSPDSRYILTATTSPRLRVDNGVRIWHVGGGLIYNEDLQELYHVQWRPQPTTRHSYDDPLFPIPSPHASAVAYMGTVKTPSKTAGAYRPPGARGQVTPLAFKREDEGGTAYVSNGSLFLGSGVNGFGKARKRVVPGAEGPSENGEGLPSVAIVEADDNLSKSALKNKKKREAKKAKEAMDKVIGSESQVDESSLASRPISSTSHERSDNQTYQGDKTTGNLEFRPRSEGCSDQYYSNERQEASVSNATVIVPQVMQAAPNVAITSPGSGGSPQDKKIRALLKKLRAIDDLKMRLAGGEKLEGTQIKKMDTEDEVRRGLRALGWHD